MEDYNVDILRASMHSALIEKLVALYKNEKWKYTLIKNAREKYSCSLQYNQLNEFEAGKSRGEHIILIMLAEILTQQNGVKLDISSESSVKID
jgi:hypothetical protein